MVCVEEAVLLAGGWHWRADHRALLELLVRLAEPPRQCVAAAVFARVLNGCVDLLQKRAHYEGFRVDRRQHDGNVHDLLLCVLPAIATGDDGKRLERVVPAALTELNVFEVEVDEGAAVHFDEVGDLLGIHDGVLQLHAAEAREAERLGPLNIAAQSRVGHLVLDGLHAWLLVERKGRRAALALPSEMQSRDTT